MVLPDGYFGVVPLKPNGWTHVVLNYNGPTDGHGIVIYYNGTEVKSDITKSGGPYSGGDSRIVVGKQYTDQDRLYLSIQVDELIFFNAALTDADVQSIYNSA